MDIIDNMLEHIRSTAKLKKSKIKRKVKETLSKAKAGANNVAKQVKQSVSDKTNQTVDHIKTKINKNRVTTKAKQIKDKIDKFGDNVADKVESGLKRITKKTQTGTTKKSGDKKTKPASQKGKVKSVAQKIKTALKSKFSKKNKATTPKETKKTKKASPKKTVTKKTVIKKKTTAVKKSENTTETPVKKDEPVKKTKSRKTSTKKTSVTKTAPDVPEQKKKTTGSKKKTEEKDTEKKPKTTVTKKTVTKKETTKKSEDTTEKKKPVKKEESVKTPKKKSTSKGTTKEETEKTVPEVKESKPRKKTTPKKKEPEPVILNVDETNSGVHTTQATLHNVQNPSVELKETEIQPKQNSTESKQKSFNDGIDNVIAQADTLYAPYILKKRDGKYVINPRIEPDDIIWVLTKIEPDKYKLDVYPGAYKYILDDPKVFLNGADFEVFGKDYVSVKETGTVIRDANGTFIVDKKPKIHLLGREKEKQIEAPVQKPVPKPQIQEEPETKEQSFNKSDTDVTPVNENDNKLYVSWFLEDNGVYFVQPQKNPDDDTNWVLTETSSGEYSMDFYEPAIPRTLRNPAAFLYGAEKHVLGRDILYVKTPGKVVKDANGTFVVKQKPNVYLLSHENEKQYRTAEPKPQTEPETKEQKFTEARAKVNEQIEKAEPQGKKLYSQSMLQQDPYDNNSKYYMTKPRPTPDEDTNFELTEISPNRYKIGIYPPAYARILANPSFIDGTNKQVIGFDTILVKEYGIAEMDANGKLIVITPPSILLADNEYLRNER